MQTQSSQNWQVKGGLLLLIVLGLVAVIWVFGFGNRSQSDKEERAQASVVRSLMSGQSKNQNKSVVRIQLPWKTSDVVDKRLKTPVRVVVSEKASYEDKLRALRKLRKMTFGTDDLHALLAVLASRTHGGSMPVLSHEAIRNDILELLINYKPQVEGLGQLMLGVVVDRSQSPLWREYVLQHWDRYYSSRWSDQEAGQIADEERLAFLEVLDSTMAERNSPMAGVALLAAERMSRERPELARDQVRTMALQAIDQSNADLASQISALQVIGQMKNASDHALARSVALNESADPFLRMAAIAAIAAIPASQEEVKKDLRRLSGSAVSQVQLAAKKALTRMNNG